VMENRLTRAICVYVGYGRYPIPALHPDDVVSAFGPERGRELLPEVDEIVAFAVDRTIGAEIDLPNIGRDAALAVKRRYRSVGRRARKALAWYVTHHWQ
jgi:hypothetical protein